MVKTEQYTRFISKDKLKEISTRSASQFISEIESSQYNEQLEMMSVGSGYEAISHVAAKFGWLSIVKKMYLQCFLKGEQITAGSGLFCCYVMSKKIIGIDIEGVDFFNQKIRRLTSSEAFAAISHVVDNNFFDIAKKTLQMSGINGSITINRTDSYIPTIETGGGHKFNIGLHPAFVDDVTKKAEASIIIFDGAITEIGQVDRLFNECHEKKLSCLLVCRDIGNDVLSTINANKTRGTLDIVPVIINDSIQNINAMYDLAVVTGQHVIDASSGVRLSNYDIDDSVVVKDVVVTKKNIKLATTPGQEAAIRKRVYMIQEKISVAAIYENMSVEDIATVFEPRLATLSSNFVNLWMPCNQDELIRIRKKMRFVISLLSGFANSGAVKMSDIFQCHSNMPHLIPASFVETSLTVSENVSEAICKSGGCIAIQQVTTAA